MKHLYHTKYIPIIILCISVGSILFSCANMSRPGGGPKDITPPRFVKSNPAPNSRNVTTQKLELEFNEIVQVEKPSEKIIVSPPQINMPKIQAQGNKVRVELIDSLKPNTTYTFDFSDAIVDNNESNILSGFAYSFSTGDTIDSLQISGILLNAADLEPITGMLVGIYSNLDDTAFNKLPIERIASSDAYGHFIIRNLKPGKYRIVALKDLNRDYRFDNPTEELAFYDSIVEPYSEPAQYADTIWNKLKNPTDSATIDTIVQLSYNKFFPNNILLTAFKEDFENRYLEDYNRKERNKLDIIFSAPDDTIPTLSPINFTPNDSNWYVLVKSITNDTLSYWLRDSLIYKVDTLQIAMRYNRTDSLNQLSAFNDTLSFVYRAPKTKKSKKTKVKENNDSVPEVEPIEFAKMEIAAQSGHDVHRPIEISFPIPIDSINVTAFHLEEKRDTLWNAIPDSLFSINPDSLHSQTYLLSHKWKPEGSYRLLVDSMAVIDMYGLHTDKESKEFSIKSMQEYSNLYFAISGVTDSAVVVLLDNNDKPVTQAPVKNGGAEFTYVKPGKYFARLYIDRNGNEKYDTGNYALKQQPEEVYYYPAEFELRAFWNVEQSWNIFEKPLDKQKPNAIKKNKPKEEKPVEEEDENESSSYGNQSNNRQSGYGSRSNTSQSGITGTPRQLGL